MKIAPIFRFTVNGNSMFPTLHPGQDVLSFNWAYLGRRPKLGDIVIVQSAKGKVKREIIKRVVRVEDDQVFVEGDNKVESTDSRDFGAVSMNQIVGKVIYQTNVILGSEATPESKKGSWTSQDDNMIPCPKCGSAVVGVYGRKDAICKNCGFKLTCCGEP